MKGLDEDKPERIIFPAADADGFGKYHDLYSSGTSVSRLNGPFKASVVAYRFPSLLLFNRVVAGASHHRDRSRLRHDGFNHYNLQVLRSGTMAAGTPGNEQAMRPGDVVVFDTSQPQRTIVTDADYVSVAILRKSIEATVPNAERLHGSILPANVAGLLSDFVLSLGRRASTLGSEIAASSATFTGKMLMEVADAGRPVTRDPENGTEVAMMQRWRAEAFIDAHISDRLLGPDQIAKAIGVSRSALYRMFNPIGVAGFILDRRVTRLRLALLRPSEARSIAELSFALGFSQESHCSRAFAAVCGTPPGKFREAARENLAQQKAAQPLPGWADWWSDIA